MSELDIMPDSGMPDSDMPEFDEFDEFDVNEFDVNEFDVNTYKPGTEEDKQALKKAKIALELGPRNLAEDKHGNEYHLPAPPRLSQQASMTSLIAQRLYIDLPGITEEAKEDRKTKVTTAINTINTLLRKVKLHWNITYDSINDKLLINPRYLVNTFYGLWNLKAGIELAMLDSLYGDNSDKKGENNVIIDYSNLKFRLRDCGTPVNRALADKIHAWMQETGRIRRIVFRRIVISIQANDKDRPEFIEFKTRLIELLELFKTGPAPPTAVITVIGADASSYDDLNIAYIVRNLLPFSIKYIITSDYFRDINKLEDSNDRSIGTPIYSSDATDIILIRVQNFCNPSSSDFTRKRNRDRSYGGTNKNKRSLLNKYTRKVKKLHKKRIPTKKVVKKYSKNYKNYKKKTLKRKHK